VSVLERTLGEFTLSTDRTRLDLDVIHGFLSGCYWSPGIPRAVVERAVAGSLCFGVYAGRRQVGFCRVITDAATFAYLADVFVVPEYRGRGLSKWMMQCVREHPDLQGLRRFLLGTRDAHGLYRQFGFAAPRDPSIWMEIHDPHVYARGSEVA
jgi:GNAT superfamily N-acetyltransferase